MSKKRTRRKQKPVPSPELMTLREVLHDVEHKIPYAVFWNKATNEAWKIEDLVTALDLGDEGVILPLADALFLHPDYILNAPIFGWGATAEYLAAIAVKSPATGKMMTVFVEMVPEEPEHESEFEASA